MKYQIIYADPPWSYSNFQGKGKSHGDVSAHYQTMSQQEMESLPIREMAADNCILFMWATFPNIQEALSLVRAWGFTYKTVAFTWVKTRGAGIYSGLGFYTNANAEICLVARRGKFIRASKCVKQIVMSPLGRHSEKPAEVRDRIISLCGDLPRIELFARQQTPGWDVWGNDPSLKEPCRPQSPEAEGVGYQGEV